MLKVFGAARHAQPTGYPHSLSRYRLNNSFGHALWIDTSTGRKVEIFNVGRHLQRTCSLRYCSDKLFGYAFRIGAGPEGYTREGGMRGGYGG